MPELPEVETIARGLAPLLEGRTFTSLDVLDRRVLPGDPKAFRATALHRTIASVSRRAKLCLVRLADGGCVAFHLKMTGRLFVARPEPVPHPHLRVLLGLDDGRALHFSDMRRFGACRAFPPGELETWDFHASLGPEPLDLAPAAFLERLTGRSGRIKALLLDQRVIAGIGNIYADEALFAAGIRPDARADALSPDRLEALLAAVQDVLCRAIEAGGSTIRDYRTAQGVEGAFQHDFKVYGRQGRPCPGCGRLLKAVRVAGRTSTFCPRCQR